MSRYRIFPLSLILLPAVPRRRKDFPDEKRIRRQTLWTAVPAGAAPDGPGRRRHLALGQRAGPVCGHGFKLYPVPPDSGGAVHAAAVFAQERFNSASKSS